jgi:hypothetical protein
LDQLTEQLPPIDAVDDLTTSASLAVLFSRLGRLDADVYATRAISLCERSGLDTVNNLAWSFYLHRIKLEEIAKVACRASADEPDNLYLLQTTLALLVRINRWDEAAPILRRWATEISATAIDSRWESYLPMFQDVVQNGHTLAGAQILLDTKRPEVWNEVVDALRLVGGETINRTGISEEARKIAKQLSDQHTQMVSEDTGKTDAGFAPR